MMNLIKPNENSPRKILIKVDIESLELDNNNVINPNNVQKISKVFSMTAINLLDSHTKIDTFIEEVKKCLK